jgi:hypothetical protein
MIIWIAKTLYADPDTGEYLEKPLEMFLERVREEYPRAHIYVRQNYYRSIQVHCWPDEGGDDVAHIVERGLGILAYETLLKWAVQQQHEDKQL